MISKKNKIFIWLLTWAGLLLVVLYSPLSSPDLYQSNPTFTMNQGVSFPSSNTINVPESNHTSNGNQDIGLPDYPHSNSYSYSTGRSNYAENGVQSGINSTGSSGSVILHVNQQETGTSNLGAVNFAAGFTNHSSRANNIGDNGISTANGFTSSQFNLVITNNTTTTRQAASASKPPYTDPGGDPKGDPIPVPDGWGFLLSLSVVYLLIKKYWFSPKS